MANDVSNQTSTLTFYYNAKISKTLKIIIPFWIRANFKKLENPLLQVRTTMLAVVPAVALFSHLLVERNQLQETKLSKLGHKKYPLSLG